jgi:hypothetical protein
MNLAAWVYVKTDLKQVFRGVVAANKLVSCELHVGCVHAFRNP